MEGFPTCVRRFDGISRHIILIFVVVLICFHNALDGDFVFDDTFAVRDNKDVTGGMDVNIPFALQCQRTKLPRPSCDVPASICSKVLKSAHFQVRIHPPKIPTCGMWERYPDRRYLSESSSGVWTHDFWGQDIRKPDSHKSYRPITTLSFRANYLASVSSMSCPRIINLPLPDPVRR